MANKTTTSTVAELPTLREIFYNSDLTEYTTAKFDKADNKFTALLKAVCKTFEEFDGIDTAATEKVVEAQALGFEQGFAYALSILGECRPYAATQ